MDLSSLTGMFVGLHAMVAMKTNTPELAIEMDEGAAFMRAAQNVLRHYSVQTTQKTLDWVALIGIGGGIYFTRGVAIANRRAVEKAQRKAAGEEPVPMFRPNRRKPDDLGGPAQAEGAAIGGFDIAGAFTPAPGSEFHLEAAE